MQCEEWKACMAQDASIVSRTRLLAELIGEVVNSFMEPISWRTMIFTATSLGLGIALVNSLFMFYRARHAPGHQPAPSMPPQQYPAAPYWPSAPGLPYMQDQRNDFRRGWSVGPDSGDVMETPSRRRRLNGPEDGGK
ncbi:hypothetical protein M422DRAFT_256935 [Sphaerobolus stellatus SS14]|uniref:Brl1/Brr6 domain-containing protein n=1 Tax=Sphaerobolus stellatus (strain SS14) TaxID=990650 RepID=A0A0C9VFA1_SPHS4|nr:hypothetical protein M422DRAFT_256935 [Sphaerobolus stellatus SS14]